MNRTLRTCLLALSLSSPVAYASSGGPTNTGERCVSLGQLHLSQSTIESAQFVTQEALTSERSNPPAPSDQDQAQGSPVCQIIAHAHPTSHSDIRIEVWLPKSNWNGNFRAVGNGGFGGSIDHAAMLVALQQGYATAGTDTGHTGSGAAWALSGTDQIDDFGYRAIHLMTVFAKLMITDFYGRRENFSYFASCSGGGRQGVMEAQRYPEDYNGILAGAPPLNWSHLFVAGMWAALQFSRDDGYLSPALLLRIHEAVLAQCKAEKGVIEDPVSCHFDPSTLLCSTDDTSACLSSKQISILKNVYRGPRRADGVSLFPGYVPGDELGPGGWETWLTGPAKGGSLQYLFASQYLKFMVFHSISWDPSSFNLEDTIRTADETTGTALNATDPNLGPFIKNGGKLILYQGWNDPAIPALSTANYFNAVNLAIGAQMVDRGLRLYMVPGMQHCSGGTGASDFGQGAEGSPTVGNQSIYWALVDWVERSVPPNTISAVKYNTQPKGKKQVEYTNLLCPYPAVLKYQEKEAKSASRYAVCAISPRTTSSPSGHE